MTDNTQQALDYAQKISFTSPRFDPFNNDHVVKLNKALVYRGLTVGFCMKKECWTVRDSKGIFERLIYLKQQAYLVIQVRRYECSVAVMLDLCMMLSGITEPFYSAKPK